MSKITSLADLKKKREELKSGLDIRVKAMILKTLFRSKLQWQHVALHQEQKPLWNFFWNNLKGEILQPL